MSDRANQKSVLAYVDAVEEGVARILFQHPDGEWRGHSLPASILPASGREGSWLKITLKVVPPPEGEAAPRLRRKLGSDDPGGDIVL